MPAPRKGPPISVSGSLAQQAPRRAVQNVSLDNYYRSATLLLQQANQYRRHRNEEQLYVMLLRYASLLVETIPRHKDFVAGTAAHLRLKKELGEAVLPELERLKLSLDTQEISQPHAHSMNRPAHLQPLTTSALPDINMMLPQGAYSGSAGSPTPLQDGNSGYHHAPAPPSYRDFSVDDLLEVASGGSRYGAGATPPPVASQPQYSSSSQVALYGDYSTASSAAPAPPDVLLPQYSSSYLASSAATSQRHLLFGPPGGSSSSAGGLGSRGASARGPSQQYSSSRYPAVPQAPSPPVQAERPSPSQADLSSAPWAQPSAGPTLQPQEMQVLSLDPQDPFRPATCGDGHHHGSLLLEPSAPPPQQQQQQQPLPPVQQATAAPGGPPELAKKAQMRDVHISLALMEEFLAYANSNTSRNIESCGILSGVLSANDSTFTVNTLIIPQQTGSSDTVQAENEEDIFEAQFSRELYPMGWIHTHPSQTCFLSSVDVHTQCGYQTMLDEAVAIVMAPTDRTKRCGIFRLSTPGGLGLVQKCSMHGFHSHPATSTGQDIYELCAHVFLNPRVSHEVIDLRNMARKT